MSSRHAIADTASLIAEPTRASILLALLDGRSLPAGELARAARLSASATSLHLAKLVEGGLLSAQREGRHRYYRLANTEVVYALEALGVIATRPAKAPALTPEARAMRVARSCYDHLAGQLSIALARELERRCVLQAQDERTYRITDTGAAWLDEALAIDVRALSSSRVLARRCLDWTERRPHIAGALGAALLDGLLARRWLSRRSGSRAIRVTDRGRAELAELGVQTSSF